VQLLPMSQLTFGSSPSKEEVKIKSVESQLETSNLLSNSEDSSKKEAIDSQ
jgi:hypothetical protein